VWRLAEQARTWLVPNAEKRLAELTGEPDRVRVRRGRQELETSQRVGGNHDYRYPARFLGAGAARQPIPPDPWTRLHDPEERPSLGDRAVQDLEAKNSPLDYVRTQAVTGRARIALERGQRQPPIHQLHGSRRAARPDQVRVERDEPDRER
jgi:hypothetical protein